MSRWTLALLFLTYGCSEVTGPTVPLDREFVLAPREAIRVEHTDAVVRFIGVEGDSRCPGDALCIHAGDAVVRIHVEERGDGPASYELHTAGMKPVVHEDLTISLVDLQPYPFSFRTIEPDDYRVTLAVTRE